MGAGWGLSSLPPFTGFSAPPRSHGLLLLLRCSKVPGVRLLGVGVHPPVPSQLRAVWGPESLLGPPRPPRPGLRSSPLAGFPPSSLTQASLRSMKSGLFHSPEGSRLWADGRGCGDPGSVTHPCCTWDSSSVK